MWDGDQSSFGIPGYTRSCRKASECKSNEFSRTCTEFLKTLVEKFPVGEKVSETSLINNFLLGLRLGLQNNCIDAPRRLREIGIQRGGIPRLSRDCAKKKQKIAKQHIVDQKKTLLLPLFR